MATALAFATQHRLPFAIRSGGHCYAGTSSTSGLLIDLRDLRRVVLEGHEVVVEPGATVADVALALEGTGRHLPTGSCPTVGLAGSTLAGGFGFLGRRFGLAADQLVAADVVLPDGTRCLVDEECRPDLFWALRGAGPGTFVAVVGLRYRTVAAQSLTSFLVRWPAPAGAEALRWWQASAPSAADTTTAHLSLVVPDFEDEPPQVDLFGICHDVRDASTLVETAVGRVGGAVAVAPEVVAVTPMTSRTTTRYLAGLVDRELQSVLIPTDPPIRSGWLMARSRFLTKPLSDDALDQLTTGLAENRVHGARRDIELSPFGGAYSAPGDGATAFVHRAARCLIAHRVHVGARARPETIAAERSWIDRSWELTGSTGELAAYAGYSDPHLDDPSSAYYGSNSRLLQAVKRRYDPDDLFRGGQAVAIRR